MFFVKVTAISKSGHEEASLQNHYEYISESNYHLMLISTFLVLEITFFKMLICLCKWFNIVDNLYFHAAICNKRNLILE